MSDNQYADLEGSESVIGSDTSNTVEKNEIAKNTSKATKSVVWYTVGSVLQKGIAFISTPIFTRLLSKAEYGAFSNISTWYALLTIFASMELQASMLRAKDEFKNDIHRYMFSLLPFGNIITGILYFVAILFMEQVEAIISVDSLYIHMMFITLMFAPATSVLLSRLQYAFRYKLSTVINIGSSIFTVLISLALVLFMEDKLLGRTLGYFVVLAAVGLACYIYIAYKGKGVKVSYWKYAINISFPLCLHLLSMYILGSSDKVIITKICGEEANALYSLAYSCGVVLSFLWSSLNSAFVPLIGDCIRTRNKDFTKKMTLPYLSVYLVPALLLMLLAPELVYIMGGEGYMEAVYVIPPVVAGSVLQYLYTLYVNIEQYEKKTWGVAAGTTLAALLNLALNAIFVPIYGYVAAAYTTLACYFSLFLIHFLIVKHMRMTDFYNTPIIFAIIVVVFAAVGLATVVYSFTVVRYVISAVYMVAFSVVVFKYRRRLFSLLRPKR